MRRGTAAVLLALGAATAAPAPARAVGMVDWLVTVSFGTTPSDLFNGSAPLVGGRATVGPLTSRVLGVNGTLDLDANGDPFVEYTVMLENTNDKTIVVTIATQVDTGLFSMGTLSGSLDVDLVDGNRDGASLDADLFFSPLGTEVLQVSTVSPTTLPGPAGFSNPLGADLAAPAGGSLQQKFLDQRSGTLPGGIVADAIGLNAAFTLSPFDRVTLVGRVEHVPEPAVSLLLAAGLACGLATWERKTTG